MRKGKEGLRDRHLLFFWSILFIKRTRGICEEEGRPHLLFFPDVHAFEISPFALRKPVPATKAMKKHTENL